MKYKSIDLFAGIGGIRMGFDKAFGADGIETVFVSEWDVNAQRTYMANFPDNFDIAGDITKIAEKDIPSFDICLAGFPCQAFSQAGHKKGFEDDYHGTCRGTLFLDVARICEYHKPKVIFCENVKGLVIHDRGRTFEIIRETFEKLGYKVFSEVLNSRNFGVPQNRERIYIVAFRNDIAPDKFIFPGTTDSTKRIRDIVEENPVPAKYYLSDVYMSTLRKHKARHEALGNGFGYEIRGWDDVAGAIVCGGMGRERNLIIDKRQTNLSPTTHIKGAINQEGIRKMTPREWARLQGFPDNYVLPLADIHSYRQLGNSVTVNVIEAIATEIKKVLERPARNGMIPKKSADNRRTQMSKAGNKGEWSEFYAFVKLLSTGRLYAADEKTNRIDNVFFPILKIQRSEEGNLAEYVISSEDGSVEIHLHADTVGRLPQSELIRMAEYLYVNIKAGDDHAFTINDSEQIMKKLSCHRISAPSSDKRGIVMQVHDINTGYNPIYGFSIKSELGKAPSLLNASMATNFVFEITGLTESLKSEINSINTKTKIKDRINMIREHGHMTYSRVSNSEFASNLMFIDTHMDRIIAELMLYYYCDNINECRTLIRKVEETNPLMYPREGLYEYKLKKFLCSVALGMRPSEHWNGYDEANGGYVIVKYNGDVVAYHIYNRDAFETYLLNNTKFERGSTSKHKFASVYSEPDGKMYVKLNLQIRFI